jgi:wobble nucleotide-excising tRNase
MSELERIAVLAEKVEQLEKRDAEDRDELRKLKDAVGSLRNFQAWIMAGIAIVGAVLGKALDPIIDKVFK